jgi:phosphoribosylaminoimidazole carboxylase (NCAIR synthetase)
MKRQNFTARLPLYLEQATIRSRRKVGHVNILVNKTFIRS